MLSRTAEYALRAVLALARPVRAGEPITADELADALGAPRNYLSKTLHVLTREGIVASVRGRQGGFTLAIPAAELTLQRVIGVFDTPRLHEVCLLGNRQCNPSAPCAAHQRWTEITDAALEPLATTTIADLLESGARPATPTRQPLAAAR